MENFVTGKGSAPEMHEAAPRLIAPQQWDVNCSRNSKLTLYEVVRGIGSV